MIPAPCAAPEAGARLNALAQALAVEVLHHHEAIAPGKVAEVEHLDDVIGPDAPCCLCFSLEALNGVDVLRDSRMQNLDRHAPMNAKVFALVDRSHAPFAEQLDDTVLAFDDLAGLKSHLALSAG